MTGGGQCTYDNKTGNSSSLFSLRNNYGGIPETLVMNLLGWLALLLLFLLIRKNVFNVMSRGLQHNLGRMTEVLFNRNSQSLTDPESGGLSCQDSGGFVRWLTNSLKCLFYSEETMLQLAGPDAVQYLKFQRHMIVFVAIMTVICLSVILPINIKVRPELFYHYYLLTA